VFCGRRVPFGYCISCGAIPVSQDPDCWGEEVVPLPRTQTLFL